MVYVDDFKLAGPQKNLQAGWKLLRKGLLLDEPEPVSKFLGCDHQHYTANLSPDIFL